MEPLQRPGSDDDAPTLDALRALGAERFDPVRFAYLDALSRRAAAHQGEVRQVLEHRLAAGVAAYRARQDEARAEMGAAVVDLLQRFPQAAAEVHRLQADGDVRGLRRLAVRLDAGPVPGPLGRLVRELSPNAANAAASPPELKALRDFRSTWARLSIDRQLSRSLATAPRNPGPLNSHLLVLRTLQAMQEMAPGYLERFMAQVETLMWIERAATEPVRPGPRSGRRAKPPSIEKGSRPT